jgi:RND family efflux transporter MFP subunit
MNVNVNQVAQLKLGDAVQVKASVFPDKTFTGRVSFIAAKSDAALNFPVEIEIANAGSQIKAGMYGTAMFDFPSQAPVVVVPRSAFVGSVNSNQVFVLDAGNTAKIRKVIAGRIMGDQVEVIQGLAAGDKVITSGQINIVDGSKVAPIK